MAITRNKCSEIIHINDGSWRGYDRQCKHDAVVEREGKHYCKQHDPVAIEERDKKRRERWAAESAERLRLARLHAASEAMLAVLDEVWECWGESDNATNPEADGYETLQKVKAVREQANGEAPAESAGKNAQTGSDNTAPAEDEDPENAGDFEAGEDGEVQ